MQLAEEISKLDNLRVKGLMAVAPYVENAEDNRHYFQKIRELSVDIARENIDNVSMGVLSMGMTGDYTVATKTLILEIALAFCTLPFLVLSFEHLTSQWKPSLQTAQSLFQKSS